MKPSFFFWFWRRFPALYYSLFPFLALLFLYKTFWALLFLFLFLWKQTFTRAIAACLLFLVTLSFMQHFYFFPSSPLSGRFYMQIETIQKPNKQFSKSLIHKGMIKKIELASGESFRCHIPASLSLQERLEPEYFYWVTGSLLSREGSYFMKAVVPPERSERHFSFYSWREKSKAWMKQTIQRYYEKPLSRSFLIALTTGVNEDFLLRAHLTWIGCAHLLAISGFHFALIASFFHYLLRPFLHYKALSFCMLGLLFCYLLFLGKSASIYRAFLFSSCFFIAPILERRTVSLNTLGVALGGSLLLDPLLALEAGFQLSFLATGAILGLYVPLQRLLISKEKGKWERFMVRTFLLNVIVHIALLPLTLYYFHMMPLHSLFYNLFFPSFTLVTLLLFLTAFLVGLVFVPLAAWLHCCNEYFTEWFLTLAQDRIFYEKTFYLERMPGFAMVVLFVLLYGTMLGAIALAHKKAVQ